MIKSSALAQPAGTYAWVHPTFVKLKRQLAERSMDRYSMTDASGWERATAVLFSCNGWLSDAADDAGLVLSWHRNQLDTSDLILCECSQAHQATA